MTIFDVETGGLGGGSAPLDSYRAHPVLVVKQDAGLPAAVEKLLPR